MSRQKRIDPDLPPTKPTDWLGATVHVPKSALAPPLPSGMTFYVFQSSRSTNTFVITNGSNPDEMAALKKDKGTWKLFKVLPETGKARIGFSESEAKAAIAAKGYHLIKMKTGVSEKS